MTASRRKFTQEFKDELCREAINTSKPIKDVATAYGVGPETLRNWLNKHRDAGGGSEQVRIHRLPKSLACQPEFGGENVPLVDCVNLGFLALVGGASAIGHPGAP